jgi:hypothetical protein
VGQNPNSLDDDERNQEKPCLDVPRELEHIIQHEHEQLPQGVPLGNTYSTEAHQNDDYSTGYLDTKTKIETSTIDQADDQSDDQKEYRNQIENSKSDHLKKANFPYRQLEYVKVGKEQNHPVNEPQD